jgi:hypothetical protein
MNVTYWMVLAVLLLVQVAKNLHDAGVNIFSVLAKWVRNTREDTPE